MPLSHPHDVFVRDFLADLDQAKAFFRLILPPAWRAEFDLDTLNAEPTSLIDEALRELQSDLLFSLLAHEGDARQLYLLFEHNWPRMPSGLWTAATLEEIFRQPPRRHPPA